MDTIQIPSDSEVEHSTSGPMWLDKSGIIVAINKGEKEHTLEHAIENMKLIEKISKNIPRPLLVDFTKVKHISRNARECYTNEENSGKVKAVGFVSSSNIGRMIANFLIGVNKSPNPIKLFNSTGDAFQWLKQYL